MRVDLRRTFLLVSALGLFLFAPALAQAQSGTITGALTDSKTGSALSNASVEVRSPSGGIAGRTLSGADGRYRVSVPAGSYNVHIQLIGYNALVLNNVSVSAGGSATANGALVEAAFQLDPIVISASKQQEKTTEAPAHVEVVSAAQINDRPAITPVEHLRGEPGVDVITQGVQSTNVVVRGFNNIFSGALMTLTDNRIAGVPSLRVNVMHFVPTTDEDLQRMELVLGPGSALYGPNTANGVLHMITKSPVVDPGTTISVTGGEQSLFQLTGRTAHRLSERVGVKLSGTYLTAKEFAFVDADEQAERAKFAVDAFFKDDLMNATGLTSAEADARIATIGNRNNDVNRWSGEARVDFRPTDAIATVFQAGITAVGSGIELTGLGAAQVKDWNYSYYQARATWNRLFAQVYLNASDAGETYLLRTGQPIVDESTLLVAQLQHGLTTWKGRQNFTYGLDYFHTNPQTQGTINGIYEDEDETTELGAYLQSQTAVSPKFDVVLAARVDDHDALPDPIFSPRAALVFKPAEGQAFRATFNRAFSTPTSLNQFLDLPTAVPDQATNTQNAAAARLRYSVRVQGTGTTGFSFRQADGSYLIRSPFTPAASGGARTLLPATNAAAFYPAAVQAAATFGAAQGKPIPAPVVQYLQSRANAIATTVGPAFVSGSTALPLSQLTLDRINPIRESTSTSYELGYKGVIRERLSLSVDGWFEQKQNFVTPLTRVTPFITLDGQQLGAQLVPGLMQNFGMTQAQALEIVTALAQIPVGVISSAEVNATSAQALATYTNVDETLDVYGMDLGAEALFGNFWSVSGTLSLVNKDAFETESVGLVTLNAPKLKGSVGLNYRRPDLFSGEVRVRYNDAFPVQSGVYEGEVKSYTLLDAALSYTIKQLQGAQVQLSVNNLLDEDYQSFIGVPNVGRMALLRLRYTLR